MNDAEILQRIHELVDAEHRLRAEVSAGELDRSEEAAQIRRLEETLDQCWDLLRQRRARREFGADADDAAVRPTDTVEGYQQ
jgi:hypothetical protein